ncbi:hypothetical protein PN36_07145 [Candidatus Thiomargarita nelsonii]|uniref:Uncharacterized protein n=1 Tax=Candidatus Thiomargarita nelsonii TaxID=1003181 RepID=A0A0A6PLN6_9GAMM|nr:hypothetical protein PN36_07145 [Candidatus Thiomargarita nelsonii]
MKKTLISLLFFAVLSGCGPVVKHLDSIGWTDEQTVYNKSQPLSPLEVSPKLIGETEKTHQEN